MKKRGVRPGIWVRPLLTVDPRAKGWMLAAGQKPQPPDSPFVIDPSLPEALAYIQEGLRRVTGWGYELVKHDFSTFDILGRWGMKMGEELTSEGWHFADRSKTSAEIVLQFYRAHSRRRWAMAFCSDATPWATWAQGYLNCSGQVTTPAAATGTGRARWE